MCPLSVVIVVINFHICTFQTKETGIRLHWERKFKFLQIKGHGLCLNLILFCWLLLRWAMWPLGSMLKDHGSRLIQHLEKQCKNHKSVKVIQRNFYFNAIVILKTTFQLWFFCPKHVGGRGSSPEITLPPPPMSVIS